MDEGLLKIMSKMGIAVISSYRSGYNFEAVGLSRSLNLDLFPGTRREDFGRKGNAPTTSTRNCATIRRSIRRWQPLPIGGFYRQRHGAETACLFRRS
ncbi:glutamate synthase central domain-containing protein [Sphingomonas panacisoli]|uniref:glutamate synthase central domain-containing protein n=1 Tax=Sphingomonas panacisoli TaxID=1813879 RepID=UPI001F014BCD|nr:glutamate synthase central domain-containing protein [Sphingomonas panacisoli]